MLKTSVPTYTATIYVGFKQGRSADVNPIYHTTDEARQICRDYCDDVGLCVTLTETEFIYKAASEPGAIIGLINYPRFPSSPDQIREHAIELGERLRLAFGQMKVSIVLPETTVMLSDSTEL